MEKTNDIGQGTSTEQGFTPSGGLISTTVPSNPSTRVSGSEISAVVLSIVRVVPPTIPVGNVIEVVIPEGNVENAVPPSATCNISTNVPNCPVNSGDIAFEGSDVSSTFLRLPLSFTTILNPPISGASSVVASSIVMTKVIVSIHSPEKPSAIYCEKVSSFSRSTLVDTVGSLVGSLNLIEMVSSTEKTESESSGSSATNDFMKGPCLSPKVPINVGDSAVDTRDVSAAFSRSAPDFISTVSLPISGGVALVSSNIEMTSVYGFSQIPS